MAIDLISLNDNEITQMIARVLNVPATAVALSAHGHNGTWSIHAAVRVTPEVIGGVAGSAELTARAAHVEAHIKQLTAERAQLREATASAIKAKALTP